MIVFLNNKKNTVIEATIATTVAWQNRSSHLEMLYKKGVPESLF